MDTSAQYHKPVSSLSAFVRDRTTRDRNLALEIPLRPIVAGFVDASGRSPPIQASWMTETSAFSAVLRGSETAGSTNPDAASDAQAQCAKPRLEEQ